MEVGEEIEPRILARLWHQEGAQQPVKSEPPPELEVDAVVALVHHSPPFEGKPAADERLLHLRTLLSTPSLQRSATVSSEKIPPPSYCSCPLFPFARRRRRSSVRLDRIQRPTAHVPLRVVKRG